MTKARAIASLALAAGLSAAVRPAWAGSDDGILGVHVRYTGEEAVAKTSLTAMRGMCPQVAVSGPGDRLGRYTLDLYLAGDGKRLARYRQGHVAKPNGPCRVAIEPYRKIDLYHLDKRVRYEFAERGNRGASWMSHPIPGGWTAARLNDVLGSTAGLTVAAGTGGQFAGMACEWHTVRGRTGKVAEYCDRLLDETRPAMRLELMSRLFNPETGAQLAYRQAESVDLSARLERSLFDPPDGAEAKPVRRPAIPAAMRAWCEAQKRATGANPCEDDPDDDED